MRRREQREHVFKLMFMTEFNSEEEMTEQLSLYFEGLGELSEQDQEYTARSRTVLKEVLKNSPEKPVPPFRYVSGSEKEQRPGSLLHRS